MISKAMKDAIDRGQKIKKLLLKSEGGTYNTKETSLITDMPIKKLRKLTNNKSLIVIVVGNENRYPIWQFEDKVFPRIRKILQMPKMKNMDSWTKMVFFLASPIEPHAKSPLQLLREGKMKEVIKEVHCFHEHGAR